MSDIEDIGPAHLVTSACEAYCPPTRVFHFVNTLALSLDRCDWRCRNCSTTNTYSSYRCTQCNQYKPYLTFNVVEQDQESLLDFAVEELRLVLLGKTCNGKSSTGNTLLGKPGHFSEGEGICSTTDRCQSYKAVRFGVSFEVVDTPGFFDPEVDDETLTRELMRCVEMVFPGPHALLVVLRADVVFTKEESDAIRHIRSVFGDDIMRHVIVVFTHCDSEDALKRRLAKAPPLLKSLLDDVDKRFVLMNNKGENQNQKDDQVKRLLKTVRGLLAYNDNQPFAHPLLKRFQDSVDLGATQMAAILGGACKRETVLELIRKYLEKEENSEVFVDGLLAIQTAEASRADDAEHKAKQLQKELQKIKDTNMALQKELMKERKTRKCVIL